MLYSLEIATILCHRCPFYMEPATFLCHCPFFYLKLCLQSSKKPPTPPPSVTWGSAQLQLLYKHLDSLLNHSPKQLPIDLSENIPCSSCLQARHLSSLCPYTSKHGLLKTHSAAAQLHSIVSLKTPMTGSSTAAVAAPADNTKAPWYPQIN